jgi:hypothetical protein
MHKKPYKYSLDIVDSLLKENSIVRIGEYNYIKKFKVKCLLDGYIWYLNFNNFISKKTKCPKCQNRIPLCNDEIDRRLAGRKIKRVGYFEHTHKKIEFECEIDGHKWLATTNKILVAERGCPLCSKNKGGMKLTNRDIDERLIGRNIKRLDDYINCSEKIRFQCELDGHIWDCRPNSIVNKHKTGCPLCKRKGEKKLSDLIKTNLDFTLFKSHKHFIIENKRRIVDFFLNINSRVIVIERNGEQHYRPVNFGQGKEKSENDFIIQREKDEKLKEYCQKNNIELYIFPFFWSDDECINRLKEINNGRIK